MSSSPVSYATAAGSVNKEGSTSSNASSPKDNNATIAPSASTNSNNGAAAATSGAKNTNGKSNKNNKKKASNNSSSSSSAANAEQTTTTSTTTPTAGASQQHRKSLAEFTPAPVPSVNVWQKPNTSSSGSGEAAMASPKNTNPLDPSNWPKPDEKKEGHNGQGSKVRTVGKEKWVPYNSANITPSPPPPANHNTNKGQNNRKKNNSAKFNGGQNGFNKNVNNKASGHSKTKSINNNNNNNKPTVKGGQNKHSGSNTTSPQQPQQQFKPKFNNRNGGGFVPHDNNRPFVNGGNRRLSHFNNQKFYVPQPDFMYNQAAAVAAANGLIQQPFVPHYDAALGLIVAQIEYYLSVENLCKDIFLRRQMNSKGLVSMDLLASFNRIKSLTNGDKALLVEACKWAPNCEIIGEKVRPRVGWENWVLPQGDRLPGGLDESEGDAQPHQQQQSQSQPQQEEGSKLNFQPANAVPFVPKSK